ncbi:lysophospholipase [Brasilonema bromeliae SPC951]|uniref:Lysophospholipase n=1 Tax=Brasilonema bromeliae SPC951 TaxID=385972 RepID=A0ABX1PD35_9CYAN|nr:lysophospholipase [Brasilonema bromeliae SPC951]
MKFLCRSLLCFSGCVGFLAVDSILSSSFSFAAEQFVVRYGFFEQSLPLQDLRNYAETQQVSSNLKSFLSYLKPKQQKMLQEALQIKMSLDIVAVDKLLDSGIGKMLLSVGSKSVIRRDKAAKEALRAAIILGAKSTKGLGIISFLEAYPSEKLVVDVPTVLDILSQSRLFSNSSNLPPKDNLSSTPIWHIATQYQTLASQGKQFSGCLFGDSVSAQLGNSLGEGTFNFALNGLSTISLVEQLEILALGKVKCQKTIIAIGGNDAWYGLSNELFTEKLKEAISLVRAMGTKEIFLIPAFYSTVAASKDPSIAAPLSKVEEINTVMNQVGTTENVPVKSSGVQPLYENNVLKDNLTSDGDHLNAEGLKIYRNALLEILASDSANKN